MTEPIKESQEAEVLSRLIDELNAGKQPKSDDPEAAELLAIAALIKKGGSVVRPPQHLLDQTVDKILADQPKKPTKRFWAWLHPGVLGAAASILLVIGFNLSPSWNSSEVQTVSAPAVVTERRESASIARSTVKEETPGNAMQETQPVQEESSAPVAAVPSIAESPSPNAGNFSANLSAIPPLDAAKKAPAVREQAPVKAEQPPIMTERASMSKKISIDEPSERWPLSILSLPGQTPDEISSDKKTGIVRQVFWKGTPQEVIVTQRRVRLEETTSQAAPIGTFNSVTVILYSQEVTVEGRRSESELVKIATQLKSP